MDPLPDKPPGCEITDAADANGVTLSWPAYKSDGGRYAGAGCLGFWLCGWAVGWFVTLAVIVQGRGHPFLYLWFAFWTVGGAVVVAILRREVVPPTPEFVRLGTDALKYDPGSGPSESRSCAELPSGKIVPISPAPAAEVPKAAIRGFGVDRVNERQRLYFDLEDRRVEIGGGLTESERAWLFAVLQQWLGAPRPAAPWARKSKEEAQA